MAGAIQDDLFIGRRAQELRGLLKIKYPMEHGVVTDWDDMERIWGWVYSEGLKALSEEVSSLSRTVRYGSSRRFELTYEAPCALDGSSLESTAKQRCCRTDLFRDVQRTCILYLRSSGTESVRSSCSDLS
jgi:centractin